MKTDLFINPTKSNYSLWNACRSWSRKSRKSRRFPDLKHTLWPSSLEWHSQAIYCSPLGVLLRKIFDFILLRQVCTQTRNTDMPDTCQVISLRILWKRMYFLRKAFFCLDYSLDYFYMDSKLEVDFQKKQTTATKKQTILMHNDIRSKTKLLI